MDKPKVLLGGQLRTSHHCWIDSLGILGSHTFCHVSRKSLFPYGIWQLKILLRRLKKKKTAANNFWSYRDLDHSILIASYSHATRMFIAPVRFQRLAVVLATFSSIFGFSFDSSPLGIRYRLVRWYAKSKSCVLLLTDKELLILMWFRERKKIFF